MSEPTHTIKPAGSTREAEPVTLEQIEQMKVVLGDYQFDERYEVREIPAPLDRPTAQPTLEAAEDHDYDHI